MNFPDSKTPAEYEATLRLLAQAPPPEGLTERIQARLQSAPARRRWWLDFSTLLHPQTSWLQAVAAAVLALLIIGGGWAVSTLIYGPGPTNATAPQAAPAKPGLSTAGAVRKPQTVEGPAAPQPDKAKSPAPASNLR